MLLQHSTVASVAAGSALPMQAMKRGIHVRLRQEMKAGRPKDWHFAVHQEFTSGALSRDRHCGRVQLRSSMKAHAQNHEDIHANRIRAKRKLITRTMPPAPPPPVQPAAAPPGNPDLHFEAAWTERGVSHLDRCYHKHATLIEAAQCAMPSGCGWYVFAVENGHGRQLNDGEDEIVNSYRFRK